MTIMNELGKIAQDQSARRAGIIGMPGHGWEKPRFRSSRQSSGSTSDLGEGRGDPGPWPLSEMQGGSYRNTGMRQVCI